MAPRLLLALWMVRDVKGFTLLELLVVVGIIGILAAIAIPVFSRYRERAFDAAAISDLRNASIAVWSAINLGDSTPVSPAGLEQYGYRPSRDVSFNRYTVSGPPGAREVHMHTKHARSPRSWHTRVPTDGGRIEVR